MEITLASNCKNSHKFFWSPSPSRNIQMIKHYTLILHTDIHVCVCFCARFELFFFKTGKFLILDFRFPHYIYAKIHTSACIYWRERERDCLSMMFINGNRMRRGTRKENRAWGCVLVFIEGCDAVISRRLLTDILYVQTPVLLHHGFVRCVFKDVLLLGVDRGALLVLHFNWMERLTIDVIFFCFFIFSCNINGGFDTT